MGTVSTPLEWARAELERLEAADGKDPSVAAPTIEFLKAHAGPESEFTKYALRITPDGAKRVMEIGALGFPKRALARWIEFHETGGAQLLPSEARIRVEAATDLMEQVDILLDEPRVHPAAPIMLAGAALEEFLRSLMERTPDAQLKGKPGIESYSQALRKAGALDRQDGKDVTFMGGLRNDAAHGNFGEISLEQARLMAQHVNLFMRTHTPNADLS